MFYSKLAKLSLNKRSLRLKWGATKLHSKIYQFTCSARITQSGTMGRSYCMKTSLQIEASPRATYDSELWRIVSLCYSEVTLELTMWQSEFLTLAYSISSLRTIWFVTFATRRVLMMSCGRLDLVLDQIGCYLRHSQTKSILSLMKRLHGRI